MEILKKIGIIILVSLIQFFIFVMVAQGVFDEYIEEEPAMEFMQEQLGGEQAYIYDSEYEVYLHFSQDDDNVSYCIDSSMEQRYIDLMQEAIQVYDDLEYISISSEVTEEWYSCMFLATWELAFEDYDTMDAIAYNALYYEEDGDIWGSDIYISYEVMDEMTDADALATLIHEIGHTFGLLDLDHPWLEDDSLMYYASSEIGALTLTPFDLYNLEYKYDEEVVE